MNAVKSSITKHGDSEELNVQPERGWKRILNKYVEKVTFAMVNTEFC